MESFILTSQRERISTTMSNNPKVDGDDDTTSSSESENDSDIEDDENDDVDKDDKDGRRPNHEKLADTFGQVPAKQLKEDGNDSSDWDDTVSLGYHCKMFSIDRSSCYRELHSVDDTARTAFAMSRLFYHAKSIKTMHPHDRVVVMYNYKMNTQLRNGEHVPTGRIADLSIACVKAETLS